MSDLYDSDIPRWSERQAELLRRRAVGELVNDAEIDSPNVAEEIESVGNEQLHAVESFLVQALAFAVCVRRTLADSGMHPLSANT